MRVVSGLARCPMRVVLYVGGLSLQQRAAQWARVGPKNLFAAHDALVGALPVPERGWSGEQSANLFLGSELLARGWARVATSGGTRIGPNWDQWLSDLAVVMAEDDPEFIWDVVLQTIAIVPTAALSAVGTGLLEYFCWQAAASHIARIEQRAATDARFRMALEFVWPGRDQIPADLYSRIQRAANPRPRKRSQEAPPETN
jgi:hypothetical protein